MDSVVSFGSRENKKIQQQNVTPTGNPEPLTILPCRLLSELIPLFAGSLNPIDPYKVVIQELAFNNGFTPRIQKVYQNKVKLILQQELTTFIVLFS